MNAFGFGGINAHLVLEGCAVPKKDKVLLLARPTNEQLLSALAGNDHSLGDGDFRIAVFDPSPERIEKAIKIVSKKNSWRNKQDIWYTNEPLLKDDGKVAFVFPGLDGLAKGEVDSVSNYFDLQAPIRAEGGSLLSDALDIFNKCCILDGALKKLGISSDINAGHSLGEWLAGYSADLADASSVKDLIDVLDPKIFELKDSKFIAVGVGLDEINPLIAQIPDVYVSNDNCPHQVILCASNAAQEELIPLLKSKQIFHQILPFQSGFHSPFVADKLDVILSGMEKVRFQKTRIPLWSATTLSPYPNDPDLIRKLSAEHLVKPVRFRELTEKLYNEGVRLFIQVGTGGLTGFIDDTLKGKSFSALAASAQTRSALAQLQRVVAALFVEGRAVDLEFLDIRARSKKIINKGIKLQLGSPIIRGMEEIKTLRESFNNSDQNRIPVIQENVSHPLAQTFRDNIADMQRMQEEVLALFAKRPEQAISTQDSSHLQLADPFSKKLQVSLDSHPYLIDHSLLRQPAGWPDVADMDPVIPMTMIFELLAELAQEERKGTHIHKILHVSVFQWMNVAKPFSKMVKGEWKSLLHAHLDIENFANAEVLLTSVFPPPPAVNLSIGDPLPI